MIHFFWKPYRSDTTDFIAELRRARPTLEAEQRAGRALLWDKPNDTVERAERAERRAAETPDARQPPYVYFSPPFLRPDTREPK